jgi:uncharacterized protein YbjT (DUF2867 family)
MPAKNALLIGATGLTGKILLQRLLENENYQKVTVLVRNSLRIQHPKLEERIIDFDQWNESVIADDVFCCLGTTIKIAKTKEAFSKVDLEYPVKIARLQLSAGSKQFAVISAMGADSSSIFFYTRVKGQMEDQLKKMPYPGLYILRPSLITGNREEKRTGEKFANLLAKFFNPLLMGPLKKYQSVSAEAIAKCMIHNTNTGSSPSIKLILSDEIKKFE